jgi:hypothetical protein
MKQYTIPPSDKLHYVRRNEIFPWLLRGAYYDAYLYRVLNLSRSSTFITYNQFTYQDIVNRMIRL